MTFKFKDEDAGKRTVIKSIANSVDEIVKMSNNVEKRASVINHLVMVNDWYIQENMLAITEGGEDADLEHLKQIDSFFKNYAKMLQETDTIFKNILELISTNFDYEDDDIKATIERIKRCQ